MEKVQFQLEATLPELKDLYEKGLFTKTEINQITRRRTALETALIRRVTRKEDFFRYAEYEINLERLRRVRWKRLKYDLNPPPPSASSYSLPRRILYILKRATVKFPSDLAVWLAYIEYAGRERMHKVVSKGLNSALQHHPLSSTLYLLSTYHHLHPTSPFPRSSIPSTSTLDLPTAAAADDDDDDSPSGFSLEGTTPARTTLLLGLRLLPRSRELWREYIKLELGWVEALRRRWRVLGIKLADQVHVPRDADAVFEGDSEALLGGEGAFGPEGEDARKAILAGQLVIEAIKSALEAITPGAEKDERDGEDGMTFRQGLLQMLRLYPSPLRTKCQEAIYGELRSIMESGGRAGAKAGVLLVTRGLYDQVYDPESRDQGGVVLSGVDLVEEYGRIGREIRQIAKNTKSQEWGDAIGPWLVEQIKLNEDNADLREYLLSTLSSLTKSSLNPSASLLLLHISQLDPTSPDLLRSARSHAAIHPTHPALQLVRVRAEIAHNPKTDEVRAICKDVLKLVTRSGLTDEERETAETIWLAYVDWENCQSAPSSRSTWQSVLRESLLSGSALPQLHGNLLARYFRSCIKAEPGDAMSTLTAIASAYRPTPGFYHQAFGLLAHSENRERELEQRERDSKADLQRVYEAWRRSCKDRKDTVDAALTYATWLLSQGRGVDAHKVVDVARRAVSVDAGAAAVLEGRWIKLLDDATSEQGKSSLKGETGVNHENDGDGDSDDSMSGSEEETGTDEEEDDDDDEGMLGFQA